MRTALLKRLILSTVLATLLGLAAGPAPAQSAAIEDLASFPQTTLQIASGKRKHEFAIWVADTPQREEQGLMFVRELPANHGMLFPQRTPQPMRMWMKNTYIALDMLFIGPDGRIARIVEHAVPESLATIDSGGPISAVLEIGGGEAARLGLHTGDRVSWHRR